MTNLKAKLKTVYGGPGWTLDILNCVYKIYIQYSDSLIFENYCKLRISSYVGSSCSFFEKSIELDLQGPKKFLPKRMMNYLKMELKFNLKRKTFN